MILEEDWNRHNPTLNNSIMNKQNHINGGISKTKNKFRSAILSITKGLQLWMNLWILAYTRTNVYGTYLSLSVKKNLNFEDE